MAKKKVTKADAVRSYMAEHPNAKPKEVVAELAARKVKVTPSYVSQTKSKGNKAKAGSVESGTKVQRPSSVKLWTFPKNSLEDAIRVPKAIEEKNAGNPMRAADLAKAVGFHKPNDWRFLDLLRSSNQYGLASGAGKTATVRIEKLGQDIVAPGSPKQRQQALLAAFHNVADFKAVADFYGDKKIPDDEFFLNTLTRDFKIPRERVETFASIFITNLDYLRAFAIVKVDAAGGGASADGLPVAEGKEQALRERRLAKEPSIREFLDTCFVMMPFGEWFDRYYRDVYVPAIKEAGFEPRRADEIFTTGSVVEQVWDQILKARVLLADLSDRNANVFYELGLAHAAKKPVVFTSPRVEDVPFDLRHLRVIIYDVREPEWAAMLRKGVTDHLKNALKDPEKAIPHPFRTESE